MILKDQVLSGIILKAYIQPICYVYRIYDSTHVYSTHVLHACIWICIIHAGRYVRTHLHREWENAVPDFFKKANFYFKNHKQILLLVWQLNLNLRQSLLFEFFFFCRRRCEYNQITQKQMLQTEISLQKSKLDTKAMVYPGRLEVVFLLNCL